MASVIQIEPATDEIPSYNPATGEELGRVPCMTASEVGEAVARSRNAFGRWRATSFADRRDLVMRAREVILAEMDEIARLISDESGKPFSEAISMEIAPVLDLMQHFARRAEAMLAPKRINIGLYALMGRSSKIVYHPLGVVGIIPAWNYPFSIPVGEIAMALMAGNSVVLKPSELTSMVGVKIREIFEKALAPRDLVQVITGDGSTGAALVAAAPEKIMFTGSVATGKKIAAEAAKNLTSVVLELGGKDAMIVLEDADLDMAADAAVWGAFCNAGQSCSSVERLYAQDRIAESLVRKIVERTKRLKVGLGIDETTSIGAMSSERQLNIVENHVESFRESGANIETGGRRRGPYFEPTVISGATNDMLPMREETFGPTLPIATFDTDEDAIALANDSEFGLTASVWTRNRSRGERIARRIEAGSVCVNEVLYTHGIGQTPWGGFKNSGRGRTHGELGLMELVQPQHIHVNHISILPNAWWFPYTPMAVETFRGFARKFASGSLLKTAQLLPQLTKRILEVRRSNK